MLRTVELRLDGGHIRISSGLILELSGKTHSLADIPGELKDEKRRALAGTIDHAEGESLWCASPRKPWPKWSS